MTDLDAAFYDRMAADLELTLLLNTYPGIGSTGASMGDSGAALPAIFTDQEVPEDAELPYVWSNGQVADTSDDTKLQPGREILRDIACYAKRNETDLIERIGNRIRRLFHRHALDLNSAETIIAEASGPIVAPTDETTIGRIVTVRLRYEDR